MLWDFCFKDVNVGAGRGTEVQETLKCDYLFILGLSYLSFLPLTLSLLP